MQRELAVAIEQLVNVRLLGEVILHTLDGHHHLPASHHDQCLILQHLGVGLYAIVLLQCGEGWVVGRDALPFGQGYTQFGVERGEE